MSFRYALSCLLSILFNAVVVSVILPPFALPFLGLLVLVWVASRPCKFMHFLAEASDHLSDVATSVRHALGSFPCAHLDLAEPSADRFKLPIAYLHRIWRGPAWNVRARRDGPMATYKPQLHDSCFCRRSPLPGTILQQGQRHAEADLGLLHGSSLDPSSFRPPFDDHQRDNICPSCRVERSTRPGCHCYCVVAVHGDVLHGARADGELLPVFALWSD
jgi:hypothetical protein